MRVCKGKQSNLDNIFYVHGIEIIGDGYLSGIDVGLTNMITHWSDLVRKRVEGTAQITHVHSIITRTRLSRHSLNNYVLGYRLKHGLIWISRALKYIIGE